MKTSTPIYRILIPESNGGNVWAKLENRNPTGTHKDRSLGPWIEHYAKRGVKELVISSSGNSARSAEKFCKEKGIKLYVFERDNTPTPKKDAFQFAKERKIPYLRASTDDMALVGYRDIAFELIKQLPRIDNIFIPTSSGTTLEGIYTGFKEKLAGSDPANKEIPVFYVVQTTKVHPIASYFDKNFVKEDSSRATAIVDNIAHRRDEVIKILKETGGGGFIISNKELEGARKIFEKNNKIKLGWQSALAFAGFLRWEKKEEREGRDVSMKTSVCLFTD